MKKQWFIFQALAILVGIFGIQRFYLKQYWLGVLYIAFFFMHPLFQPKLWDLWITYIVYGEGLFGFIFVYWYNKENFKPEKESTNVAIERNK